MSKMAADRSSFTWSTSHKQGGNSLAHQFPSFQISAEDAKSVKVEARAPSGRTTELSVIETNGVYTCNFTPTEVGEWMISIMYENRHIQGSPFSVRVYDASQVRVFGLEGGAMGASSSFSVDASGAGDGQLTVEITHNGRQIPPNITQDGRGIYRVSFTPDGGGFYSIRVYFAGMEVNGSPFTYEIVDSSQVRALGEGLSSAEVNQRAVFNVNTGRAGGPNDITANITSPRGHMVPCNVIHQGGGNYNVEYTPTEIGEYLIEVNYYNKAISGSPFRANAFDWNRIQVQNIKSSSTVGRMVEFDIDASQAGSGNLEIMVNDGTIPCSVQNRGNRQFHATFMPREAISHYIQMKFNGRDIPGSPWLVDVRGVAQVAVSGPGTTLVSVGVPASFDVRVSGGSVGYEGNLMVNINSPTQRVVPVHVTNTYSGAYRVEYTPTEVGNHLIDVTYDGVTVPGSPYIAKAYNSNAIVCSAIPNGVAGKALEFTIDVTQAGEGQLEIMVNKGQVPNSVKMLRKGVFLVTFTPRDARNHIIDVKFNGELLRQCPINVNIMDASRVTVQGEGLHQVAVNKQSYFRVNTASAGDADVSVRVTSPNGELVPARIVQQPDGDYKVEYSSRYTGRHTVEILYAGQAIMGSPFYVEIYDPNKIHVTGVSSGNVGQMMEFDIIRNEAGKAELGLNITSPSGRSIAYNMTPTGLGDHVTYMPNEAGLHNIYVTYGGLEVPGCAPLVHTIQDMTSYQNVTASGEGLYRGNVEQPANFTVDTAGARGQLTVTVEGPNSLAKCNIEPELSGRFSVTYVPVEVGIYKVIVKWNDKEINGSPFRPKVYDARRVMFIGGWDSLLDSSGCMALNVHETRHLEFDVKDAGPGTLSAEISGPYGNIPATVQAAGSRYTVSFTPPVEGDYNILIKWCDIALPRMPIRGFARAKVVQTSSRTMHSDVVQTRVVTSESRINHEKVVLTGLGLQEARIREECEFVIDGTDAGPGHPEVRLTGVNCDIDVMVQSLGGNKYRCVYFPEHAGAYLLNIHWSDRLVRGSPFKVNVVAQSDANQVVVSGEGLRVGTMGKEIKCVIDTRRAGPGELTAHCTGTNKVAFCELFDHHDGTFTLTIQPQEHGRHILQVKYGGQHVPGSPFTLKIAGAPDASKVRVSGPGIEHGILATYQSRFICETRGAGAGQLTVRIRGPKGAFRVEMQRESQKDRTILCRYDPTEVGDYIMSIKWSGDHVPGSPYHVQIFDTQEELERFMAENPHRRLNAQQFPDRDWREDI